MLEFFRKLLTSDFMPHGHCYFWTPEIVWPIAVSNGIIALAYFAIPISLIYIYRKRGDFKYVWMAVIFALFIFGCGVTHIFDIINIWQPFYRLDATVRVVTALASIGAAIVLVKITPQIVKLPTLEQWRKVNEDLKLQIQQLKEKDMIIEAIRKFEEMTEAVPQIMWICKKDGQMVYINRQWFTYTGSPEFDVSENPLTNDFFRDYVHPDDYEKASEAWELALKSKKTFEYELRLRDRNGAYQWFLSRGVQVKDDLSGNWFGTFTNIHLQKKQNEELHKINSDLDNFVYAASHDLRAPLTNMIGILSLLKEDRINPMPREKERVFLNMLGKSVDKLRVVIDDLTEVSKLQKDIASFDEDLSMPDVLEEIEAELDEQIKENFAVIKKELNVQAFHFSKKNMRSLLYNLITNSLKYRSNERDPEIIVRTYSKNHYKVLEISDNGIGIDEKYQQIIFELFRRLHSDNRGTGVGLFIVKRIVDNAGGKIEVDSQVGVGSTFRIYLRE